MRAQDWRRTPGRGRYAQPERERRFLVRAVPDAAGAARLVEDRYLRGTRLRLRRVTVDGEAVHKLAQKVRLRDDDPAEVALTNLYLDAAEHAVLAELPADVVVKTRTLHDVGGTVLAVDVFAGPLTGLVLAECEVDDLAAPLPDVPWLGREVTRDDRYSGGRLAVAAPADVALLLAASARP